MKIIIYSEKHLKNCLSVILNEVRNLFGNNKIVIVDSWGLTKRLKVYHADQSNAS